MEKKQSQPRKAYKKHDQEEVAQVMMSFRIDIKNKRWLDSKPNKGRYINELIKDDMHRAIKNED